MKDWKVLGLKMPLLDLVCIGCKERLRFGSLDRLGEDSCGSIGGDGLLITGSHGAGEIGCKVVICGD